LPPYTSACSRVDEISPIPDFDLMKLPRELRDKVYEWILEPVSEEWDTAVDQSIISVAHRMKTNAPYRAPYWSRPSGSQPGITYFTKDQYWHIESCTGRILRMKENAASILDEFMQSFFRNTVLKIRLGFVIDNCEKWASENTWAAYDWFNRRKYLFPYIQHISLTVNNMADWWTLATFCRTISREVFLKTFTLWICLHKSTVGDIFSKDTQLNRSGVVDAIRQLIVYEFLEIHVSIDYQGTPGIPRNEDVPLAQAEREMLEESFYSMFLPDTLRDTVSLPDTHRNVLLFEAGDEYLGIADLFDDYQDKSR